MPSRMNLALSSLMRKRRKQPFVGLYGTELMICTIDCLRFLAVARFVVLNSCVTRDVAGDIDVGDAIGDGSGGSGGDSASFSFILRFPSVDFLFIRTR